MLEEGDSTPLPHWPLHALPWAQERLPHLLTFVLGWLALPLRVVA